MPREKAEPSRVGGLWQVSLFNVKEEDTRKGMGGGSLLCLMFFSHEQGRAGRGTCREMLSLSHWVSGHLGRVLTWKCGASKEENSEVPKICNTLKKRETVLFYEGLVCPRSLRPLPGSAVDWKNSWNAEKLLYLVVLYYRKMVQITGSRRKQ